MKRAICGLYAVTPDTDDTARLLAMVEAALAGGARLLQYRNKTAGAALRLTQGRALLALCREFQVPLIINDHLDLALALDADGVHLGGDDGLLPEARARLGPAKILGVSCYRSVDGALDAQRAGADYVAFGGFFPSAVKPGAVRAPLTLLRDAKQRLSVPVVAIGGITHDNAPQLIAAGADGLAVISALFGASDVESSSAGFLRSFYQAAGMKRSQKLFQRAQLVIPGGVNSPVRAFRSVGGTPLFIQRGKGAQVWDADGRAYIDYVGSWGPLILGHAHPEVVKAVQQAADRGLSFGAPTEQEVEMAELLCRLVPSMEQVRLVSSGTEATMSAIRLARGFTGRQQDHQVRRLLPRPRRCPAGQGGFGRAHLRPAFIGGRAAGPTAADTLVLEYNNEIALERSLRARRRRDRRRSSSNRSPAT